MILSLSDKIQPKYLTTYLYFFSKVSYIVKIHVLFFFYFFKCRLVTSNTPRSMCQNSNMTLRLSGHFSIFGLVFFVLNSLLGIARQWSLEKFAILTLKPRSHVRIQLIYRTSAIAGGGKSPLLISSLASRRFPHHSHSIQAVYKF